MKKCILVFIAAAEMIFSSGCSLYGAEMYPMSVDPYVPVGEEDLRSGECSIQLGEEVSVCGQGAWYKENDILISSGGIYTISGTYDSGCIKITTDDPVKLIFSNAEITNPDGYAVESSADRLIIASDGTSSITGNGGEYYNAVYSNGMTLIAGSGSMDINGGIFSSGGIQFGRGVTTFCEILRTEKGDIISGVLSIG